MLQVNTEALMAWSESIGSKAKRLTCPSSLGETEGVGAVNNSRWSLQGQVSASGLNMARVPVGLGHLGSRVNDKLVACIPAQ